MLCAIYKTKKKEGMYLYIEKRDYFEKVPTELKEIFGPPIFVMLFNLQGNKNLVHADKAEVLNKINKQGYYLQIPRNEENLFKNWIKNNKKTTALHNS